MTHRLATDYAKNYCNRTPIVKVMVENVVTCFFFWGGDTVYSCLVLYTLHPTASHFSINSVFSHHIGWHVSRAEAYHVLVQYAFDPLTLTVAIWLQL